MPEPEFTAQSPTHADTSINDIVEEGHMDVDEQAEGKTSGVKRALMQSPEKSKKKAKSTSSSKSSKQSKSPKKGSKAATSASASKKGTPKTPKSGAKSTSKTAPSANKAVNTAAKKKKLAALESQEEELKQSLERLRRERSKQQAKLNKLEESQGPIYVAPKVTTMDIFNGSTSVLDTFSRAENFFPTEAVDDAITVWNFLNTFSKQLMLNTISWEDFSGLVNYTGRASAALTDIFCAPMKLILSDSTSLHRLNATLPKRAHYHTEDGDNSVDVEVMAAEQLGQTFASAETFDHEYNGFKLFAHKISSDMVDHIRWQCILRAILLRLEPVKQLRRAVLEVAVAIDLVAKQQQKQPTTSSTYIKSEVSTNANEHLQSTAKLAKVLAVGTTPRKKARFELAEDIAGSDTASATANNSSLAVVAQTPASTGVLPLCDEVMERINTPRNKGRKRGGLNIQGLNKDAIFGMTANYTLALDRVSSAAVALETQEVHTLSAAHKLIILRTLCEACFDTARITELLERNADERANQITAMNKKLRDQKAKMKEVSLLKKDRAIEICRQLMKHAAASAETVDASAGKKKGGAAKDAKGNKDNSKDNGKAKKIAGASAKTATAAESKESANEPSAEMVNGMVDDLVMLEEYGVNTVIPDLVCEEVSDDEEDINTLSNSNAFDDSDDDDNYNNNRRRQTASARAKAKDRQRLRDERRYRNEVIEQAQLRLLDALEARSERALRSAIKNAERAKFKGRDENNSKLIYATVTLKNAYKALYEIDLRAKEEREAVKHEKLLDEFFVRSIPVGVDRFGNQFWRFNVDDHRLFVQLKTRVSVTNAANTTANITASNTANNTADGSEGAQNQQNQLQQLTGESAVLSRLFNSRPGQVSHRWRIYSSQTELWRIASSLHEAIDCEKELKRKLIAAFELTEPAVEYVTDGHEWIGRKVARTFGRKKVIGTIIGWAPTVNEDPALWRVMHSDGDEEDLEEHEVIESLVEEEEEEEEDEEENEENEDGEEIEEGEDEGDNEEESGSGSGTDTDEEEEEAGEEGKKEKAVAVSRTSEHDGEAEADFNTSNKTSKGRLSNSTSANNLSSAATTSQTNPDTQIIQEEPKLVKNQTGVSRHNNAGRSLLFPPGIAGLRLEISRLLAACYELLKKRGAAIDREAKRQLETALRQSESVSELKPLILSLEELMRSVQVAADRHDAEEVARQRALQQTAMEEEGWIFGSHGNNSTTTANNGAENADNTTTADNSEQLSLVGQKARRFFKGFGKSDGFVLAFLPADKNDGLALFRLVHSDGDEEDIDEIDLKRALAAYTNQWSEQEAKQQLLKERRERQKLSKSSAKATNHTDDNNMDVDSEDDNEENVEGLSEEDEDSDNEESESESEGEDEEEEERNGFPSLALQRFNDSATSNANTTTNSVNANDARLMWPTHEVRMRWQEALSASHTVSELAMATVLLEEVAYGFGVLGEGDVNAPLLFRPSVTSSTTNRTNTTTNSSSSGNNYASTSNNSSNKRGASQQQATISQRSMLSPRKAKKHALGEIARQSRYNDDDNYDDDDDSDNDDNNRRNKRRRVNYSGGNGGNNGAEVYNSGRPSRSAAQRIVSYAE